MGLLDRFAKAIAAQIEKAPAGSVIMTEAQMRNAGIGNTQYGYGTTTALPRDPRLAGVPFSPGLPLIPGAINPVREDGRPDPRRYEFLVAQNINVSETRLVPFKTLRAAADQIDILRRCIEVMKAKVTGLEWDIVLGEDATEKVIADTGVSQIRAMSIAKEQFAPEISRLKQFWEMPDPSNGLNFTDWLAMALEEILVLDAWAVWPQQNVGGKLMGLQILDGSTIKPLIDDRGMRPMAPQPAYQQILYGFPRVEFEAPDETSDADGEFTADQLAYFVKNRRAMTVYGYSPVERALALADIYVRRQQWLRKEYTDGVLPQIMFETDADFGGNPDLLRAYENIFNDDLSGQTEQRMRARVLPQGFKPVQFEGYGERFKDTLDEYLVNSICGHFGVQPSEIGFAPKGGLGGAGHQEGQAESSEVIGLVPMADWVSRMLTSLSYNFLGMPRELEFKLMPSARENTADNAKVMDTKIKNGQLTINEARATEGLPLIETPEADMPMVIAGTSAFFLSPEGIVPVNPAATSPEGEPSGSQTQAGQSANQKPQESGSGQGSQKSDDQSKATPQEEEVKSFLKWARKSRVRPFNFEHLEASYGDVLNKFVLTGDLDGARWYAERYLGL
jgi:Phage portal protein